MAASDEDVSARAAAAVEEKAKTQIQAQMAEVTAEDASKGDADASKEDEEETVLLSEVLRHDELMSETANAVLGDCSDTNCSYPMGYMRQVSEPRSPSALQRCRLVRLTHHLTDL
jgi:hypothetical protein